MCGLSALMSVLYLGNFLTYSQQMSDVQYLPSNSSIKEVLLSLFFKRRCQA